MVRRLSLLKRHETVVEGIVRADVPGTRYGGALSSGYG